MKILLVEDNPQDAFLFRSQLEDAAIDETSITLTANLRDACDAASKSRFDVVVLDLDLPDSRGLGTIRTLQRAAPSAPIVVLSGHDDSATAMHAVELGAEEFLLKGFHDSSVVGGRSARRRRAFAPQLIQVERPATSAAG